MEFIVKLILCLTMFAVCAVMGEILYQLKVHPLITRKTTHILSSFASLSIPFLFPGIQAIFVIALLAMLNIFSNQLKLFKGIENGVAKSLGSIYYPIAIGINSLLFNFLEENFKIYAVGILILGLADGLSAIVGFTFGQHKYVVDKDNTKSWEGSITFAITSLVLYMIFSTFVLEAAHLSVIRIIFFVLYSSQLAFLESFLVSGKDNLFIAPIGSLGLQLGMFL